VPCGTKGGPAPSGTKRDSITGREPIDWTLSRLA
jgi:hypothetical protein